MGSIIVILRLYLQAGWEVLRQKGSHVVMGKGELRETIPMHRELKRGPRSWEISHLPKSEGDPRCCQTPGQPSTT